MFSHLLMGLGLTVLVVAATAGFGIEEPTTDIGIKGPIGALFLKLVEAAFAATIAKALPLGIRHLSQ